MLINDWLSKSTTTLEAADIGTARLDCLVLLEDETGKDRGWLLAHPDHKLQGSDVKNLNTKITRRSQHIPLAYIRGKTEFYGREFQVNAHTLVPRPETESIIQLLRSTVHGHPQLHNAHLIDIGTGSGAIAITAKLEFPGTRVCATDIDEKCLETAQNNADRLGATVTFLQGNLLEPAMPVSGSNTLLLCNLPYVPDNFQINRAATHEPRHALFGGTDGLDLYRELFASINGLIDKPITVLTESLPPQHEVLTGIAKAAGYALRQTDDFIQLFSRM